MEGQINPDSSFGKAIMSIAADPTYQIFLDVGTWNGMGTTRCLVLATNERPGSMIYSIEANRNMFNEAVANWPDPPSNLKLLYGKLATEMLSYTDITNSPKFKDIETHFMLHYGQDVYDFLNAPLVELPPQIDVAILDGGEFCGPSDLSRAVQLSPKIIALDDTHCMKNDTNLELLLNSPDWQLIEKSDDRNGWAIFKKAS